MVVLIDFFIAAGTLSELVVDFASLSDSSLLYTQVVNIYAFLVEWGVASVVSHTFLSKDVGVELFLFLQVGVDFSGSDIYWLGISALGLPIGVSTDQSSALITVIFNWSFFFIATAKDARLELLVLLVLPVHAGLCVHALLR